MTNKRIEKAIEEALLESLSGGMDNEELENLERRVITARKLAPKECDE
jgi:hypothetical protein